MYFALNNNRNDRMMLIRKPEIRDKAKILLQPLLLFKERLWATIFDTATGIPAEVKVIKIIRTGLTK